MVSCGMREVIRFLVQHKLVDVLVTTAGGIEEDFIKCIAPTYIGSFELEGKALRRKGINRIGNLLMPNDNYCKFEDFMTPILDQMVKEQEEQQVNWSPSKFIHRLGKEINNPESIYYWCYKNNIPVFSPAIIDGSIGDMIYFHSYRVLNPLRLDIVQDIRLLNDEAMQSAHNQQKTGFIFFFPRESILFFHSWNLTFCFLVLYPRHAHPGRGSREASHMQRKSHEKRRELLCVHQHRL
jgi:deoxyhypusine synthase